jgi:hypothetical protein
MKLLNSKHHIELYNEIELCKKNIHRRYISDSVYESKIDRVKVSYFSKTVGEYQGKRRRALSNADEVKLIVNIPQELDKQKIRSQNRGERHYYPDIAKSPDDNFGLNSTDDDSASVYDDDKAKFHESLNANNEQCMIDYRNDIRSYFKYKQDYGLWEPKGNLVSTIYDHGNFSKILDLDVSQDSKYFVTTSQSKFKF